jgi:monoamine oxidase
MKVTRRGSLKLLASALGAAGLAGCGGGMGGRGGSVLVVGAGLGGISAARALKASGYEVVVLEARDRVGGRTVSVPLGRGAVVDLGASWIHGVTGNPIAALAKELGIDTIPTDIADGETFEDGEVVSDDEDEALEALAEELADAIEAEQDRRDEDVDLLTFFEEWASDLDDEDQARARYLLATEYEYEYAADASLLSLYYFDSAQASRGAEVMLRGGYGQLAEALAEDLDVRLGVEVTRIEYGEEGVEVHTKGKTFEADFCVCAAPLGVLKGGGITFAPPLPAAHRAAMGRLVVGGLEKLFLRFAEPFWEEETEAHWLGRLGAPVGRFAGWVNLQALTGQPILLGFNAGRTAADLPDDDEEVVALALEDLRGMFGESVTEPVRFVRTRWSSDPYARGSYSAFGVGSSPADIKTLARPVGGRLFFAGEHTDPNNPATTHGAWRSGQRAAADVRQA